MNMLRVTILYVLMHDCPMSFPKILHSIPMGFSQVDNFQ